MFFNYFTGLYYLYFLCIFSNSPTADYVLNCLSQHSKYLLMCDNYTVFVQFFLSGDAGFPGVPGEIAVIFLHLHVQTGMFQRFKYR